MRADLRLRTLAQLISYGGDWFLTIALLGLVLDLTGSAVMASIVVVAQLLPYVLLSPFVGVMVDRLNRQRLMIAADVIRAVLCLGFLMIDEPGEVWLAFTLLVGLSIFGATFEPASVAAMPNLVDEEDLPSANALSGASWGTMLAIGAALGGVVAARLGRDAAFIGDALSFAVSGALLIGIRRPFSEVREEEHPGIFEATAETVRYARRDHRVLALLAVKGGVGLAGGVIVLLPVFAHEVFHRGDEGIGILMSARGLGALIGPFLGRWLAGRTERRLFTAIGISLASFGLFYAFFPLAPSIYLAAIFPVLAHLGGGAQWTLSTYGLQTMVPDRLRGRVFAFDFALVTLSITVSNLLTGWSAERFGPEATMYGLAAVAMLYSAAWWAGTRGVRAGLAGQPAPEPPGERAPTV